MDTLMTTTTAIKVATLTIGEGRNGSGKLWLDGRHIFDPANMPAGTPYDVEYFYAHGGSGVAYVVLDASPTGKRKVHLHKSSGNPIVDLTNKKISDIWTIGTRVIVESRPGRIHIYTAPVPQQDAPAWS